MKREPILQAGTIVSLVAAALGLYVAFGGNLNDAQREAIMQVAMILSPFVVAGATWLLSRPHTTTLKDPRDATGKKLVRQEDGFDAVVKR